MAIARQGGDPAHRAREVILDHHISYSLCLPHRHTLRLDLPSSLPQPLTGQASSASWPDPAPASVLRVDSLSAWEPWPSWPLASSFSAIAEVFSGIQLLDFPAWAAASSDKRTRFISEDWEGRCRVQAGGEVRKRKKAWVTSKEESRLQIHAPAETHGRRLESRDMLPGGDESQRINKPQHLPPLPAQSPRAQPCSHLLPTEHGPSSHSCQTILPIVCSRHFSI